MHKLRRTSHRDRKVSFLTLYYRQFESKYLTNPKETVCAINTYLCKISMGNFTKMCALTLSYCHTSRWVRFLGLVTTYNDYRSYFEPNFP